MATKIGTGKKIKFDKLTELRDLTRQIDSSIPGLWRFGKAVRTQSVASRLRRTP
jgi:hypothetical protein